jgi:RHS repeat-associated protein
MTEPSTAGPHQRRFSATRIAVVASVCSILAGLLVTTSPPPAAASGSIPVSIGTVSGTFYPNPNNSGAFDASQLGNVSFTESFPQIDFNPPTSAQVYCSSSTGINEFSRPFTDVIQSPNGTCTTQVAQGSGTNPPQAGVNSSTNSSSLYQLYQFEATLTAPLTVAAAGDVTFNFYSDDGWILGAGPTSGNGSTQPTYVSGEFYNAPSSTPLDHYQVVGSYNTNSSPTQNQVTVDFPAAGTYPIEVDYTECCGGQLALTLGTTFSNPITGNGTAPSSATGVGAGLVSKYQPTCKRGKPVNCASGDFTHTFADLSVAGRGPGLSLTRTYNSLSASTKGIFGNGWSSSWDVHLTSNGSGSETITAEDGSQVTATPNGSGWALPAWADSTLTQNADGTWSYVRSHGDTFTVSSSGQLLSITDRNGYATSFSYNGAGQLSSVTDAAGRSASVSFGANGLVSQVADPAGNTTSYGYDSAGDLTSVTDPLGRTTSFSYDPNHLLLTMTDPRGGVTSNVYDASGRVTSQTDPMGLVTTFAYSGDNYSSTGGTTTIADPHGNVQTQSYTNGELMSLTNGVGSASPSTWSYTYDPFSMGTTSVIDPDGHKSTSTYDQDGNLLSSTDALGNTTSYSYNSFDQLLSVTDPMGITTSYTYDADGNLLTKTLTGAGGSPVETTTYTYGDSAHPGDVTQMMDPDGHVTSFTYDTYGDTASTTTHPSSSTSDTTADVYDVLGSKLCEASPNATAAGVACPAAGGARVANTSTWVYDADSEVTSATDANGNTTSYSYDADGNQVQATDPLGNVTETSFDADNRKTSATSGYGTTSAATTSYAYDLAHGSGSCSGQVSGAIYCTTTTGPLGAVTANYFDAQNRQVAQVLDAGTPQSQTTLDSYDGAGNLLTQVSPAGTTTNGYDADKRLVSITYSSPGIGYATAHGVTYTYNADGQRIQMTDGTGTTSYSYDSLGRLSSTTNGAGAAMGYGYDGDSNITSLTYPNGQSVNRGYDGAGEWTSVADWQNHTTSFSYDHDGNLANQGLGNGMQVASSYDNTDNILNANLTRGSSTIDQATYSRNADNQVANDSQCGSATNCYSETYNYDPLGRVASLEEPQNTPPAYPYSYDTAGNLTGFPTGIAQSYNSSSELTNVAPGIGQLGPVETSFVGDGASSAGVNLPTGVMPFDQILVGVVELNSITTNTPTGYTSVGTYSASATGSAQIQLFRRTATGGESSVSLSFNLPVTGGVAIMASVYRGVDATDPIEQLSSASGVLPPNNTISVPSITTQLAKEDLLMYQGTVPSSSTGGSFSTPGMSEVAQVDTGSGNIGSATAGLAGTVQASAGATGAKNVTYSGGAASLVGVLLSLRPSVSTLSYDPSGDRTAETTPGRPSQTMGYDQAGRLVSYASSGGTYGYAYNGDGLRMQKTPPSGPVESYSWDVTSSTPEIVTDGSMSYVYGPGGMVLEQIQAPAITYVNGTTYLDALGTTTSQTINLPGGTVAGDQVIVGVTEAQGETSSISGYTSRGSFSQPNADSLDVYNHTVAAGDSSFTVTWQTNGSTHQKEVVVAVYRGVDPNTPVDAVIGAASSSASTSLSIGPLTASQAGEELVMVQSAIGNTTGVTWSANGMAERSPSSASQTLTASAVADQSLSSAGSTGTRTETVSGSVTTPNPAGALIALLPVQAYFYVHDQRGTTRVISDSAGNVLASYFAGPYGQNPASSGSVAVLSSNPFLFEGQYTDAESGYQYLVYRYYDPTTGQFISSDPLVDITGQPYTYVGDDPVNETDPLGLGPWFNPCNWGNVCHHAHNVVHGAKTWLQQNTFLGHSTLRVCVGLGAAIVFGGNASVCVGESDLSQVGITESVGVALGLYANGGISGSYSGACSLHQLSGPFWGVNGGWDLGGSYQWGTSQGNHIHVFNGGLATFGLSGEKTWTWVQAAGSTPCGC